MKCRKALPLLLIALAVLPGCSTAVAVGQGRAPQQPTLVLNITSGEDNLHAVAMALHLADHALADGRTTLLFLNVKAPVIASKGFSPTAKVAEQPPIRQHLQDLISKGARVIVCSWCAKAVGVEDADLLPGVEMATREKLLGALHANSVVFTY